MHSVRAMSRYVAPEVTKRVLNTKAHNATVAVRVAGGHHLEEELCRVVFVDVGACVRNGADLADRVIDGAACLTGVLAAAKNLQKKAIVL